MNFIIVIIVLAFLGMLIFWRAFRTWIVNQLRAIPRAIARYFPVVWRAFLGGAGIYVRIIVYLTLSSLVLMISSLIINAPGFTAFAFVVALSALLLTWLPAGIVLRTFRVSSAVVPKGLKVLVSWVALIGFISLLYPDIISFKFLFGAVLLWFVLLGMSVKINVLDKIIFPMVIIMCLTLGWKHFCPHSFRSTTRYVSSWGEVAITGKDRGSINNEAEAAVTYGHAIKDIPVAYIASFKKVETRKEKRKLRKKGRSIESVEAEILDLRDTNVYISHNTVVKIFNHKEEVKHFQGQGFIQIQLPRNNNSFVKGLKCWVEADLIQLVTPRELAEAENQKHQAALDSLHRARFQRGADSIAAQNQVIVRQPGVYLIDLKEGEIGHWNSIPYGCTYNFDRGQKVRFTLIYRDGSVANSWEPGNWPSKYEFKIKNLHNEKPVLIIRQVAT